MVVTPLSGTFRQMLDAELTLINEEFHAEHVSPHQMDVLLANGWRHFGTHFFRYNWALHGFDIRAVIPLRIRLKGFYLSKSQRRILRKNQDLTTLIRPAEITEEAKSLFERHKLRFRESRPDSIYDFLSNGPANCPTKMLELGVYNNRRKLLAVSYFDVGESSASGVYAVFEPDESARSLGIFTMLKEIEHSVSRGNEFYYQGYTYEGDSFYDYKKRFRGSEAFDWSEGWEPFELLQI